MNNKGIVHIGIVAIILALVILAIFLVSVAQRECNSNRDCPENAYCNTNYECIEYPKQIVATENNFVSAALILGISLITAAYIFKGGKFKFKRKKD